MKSIFLIVFVFVFELFLAQDSLPPKSKITFGLSAAMHLTKNSRDNNAITFGLLLKHKKFVFTGGPKFFLDGVLGTNGNWFTNKGYNLDLRYLFREENKRFRYFANVNVDFFSQHYIGYVFDDPLNNGNYVKYDQDYFDKTLSLNGGAGCQFRMGSQLFVSVNAGVGYYFFAVRDIWKDKTSQQIVYEKYKTYKDLNGINGLFSFGLFFIIN